MDISKEWIDVACFNQKNPDEIFKNKFVNGHKGFLKMATWIRKIFNNQKECIICFENTGSYEYHLCEFLTLKKWDYKLESPLRIKKSSGITRGKSDKADAVMIAKYIFLKRNKIELSNMPEKEIFLLKTLLIYRERLLKTLLRFSVTSKELRQTYTEEIYKYVSSESESVIAVVKKQIEKTEKKIKNVIDKNKNLKRLYLLITSVPGIGPHTATYILVYTKAFSTHLDYRKFACYCGIAPFEYSSGKSLNLKARIHPLGNKKIKALLTTGALTVIHRSKSEFVKYYQRKLAQGKHPQSIINVIRNKMIARVYAAVRTGKPYVALNK